MKTLNRRGFTLVEIMIVVAIVGLLAAIAIPNFVKAKVDSDRRACVANLKLLQAEKAKFCDKAVNVPLSATELQDKVLVSLKDLKCPRGGTYTIGSCGVNPTCSDKPDEHTLTPAAPVAQK